ncbi:MAG: DUF4410 domain-containing protein [Pseudomonadota bacterium]
MKKTITLTLVALSMIFASSAFAGSWSSILSEYQCLEVEKFSVDRDNFSNKEMERAASIPDARLTSLQHKIVGEIVREKLLPKVTKADKSSCKGKTLVFGGQVTDYKEGNRAARIFIGLGAGKQKFEVQSYLKDKATGKVLTKKEIIDRKIGGISGGDEAKGESDFAEKVVSFVKSGK